jgi:hypothetical protein
VVRHFSGRSSRSLLRGTLPPSSVAMALAALAMASSPVKVASAAGSGDAANLGQLIGRGAVCVTEPPYNAVGNGVADDTAAIQAALNDQAAKGGGIVLVPWGNFLCPAGLTLASRVSLVGLTGHALPGIQSTGPWLSRLSRSSGGDLVTIPSSVDCAALVGLQLFGGGSSSGTGKGVNVQGGHYHAVTKCGFNNFPDQAIYVAAGVQHLIDDNFAQNCLLNRTRSQVDGVLHLAGGTDIIVRGGEYTASVSGLTGGGQCYATAVYGGVAACLFEGGVYEISDGGLYFDVATGQNRLVGVRADLNYGHGFRNDGSNHLVGCYALNNSRAGSSYDNFTASPGATGHSAVYSGCVSHWTLGGIGRSHYQDDSGNGNNTPTYAGCTVIGGPGIDYNFASNAAGIRLSRATGGGASVLPAGATNPVVNGSPIWKTANTSATRYTNFTCSDKWAQFTLLVNDVNVTIGNTVVTNDGIQTGTGADVAVAQGRVLRFIRQAGVWWMQ